MFGKLQPEPANWEVVVEMWENFPSQTPMEIARGCG